MTKDDDETLYRLSGNSENGTLMSYMRPTYELMFAETFFDNVSAAESQNSTDFFDSTFTVALVYSGSRWFVTLEMLEKGLVLSTEYNAEYHAFWGDLYNQKTYFISDPTTASTPVGVDFYYILSNGRNYGPFGLLEPIANLSGAGFFHCHVVES